MVGLHIALFHQLLKLTRGIIPRVIFAELVEVPWQQT